ncbi:BMP family ABC transporter substrate-binding protein [Pelomonas sp. KK5]|uniref:BMP family ABC transporter substrate-binding protein n=1 Tax=Pelomonas sp. KK5 TaxID=1855730 RepID=UPI00097C9971|nr:BMP family ABC transporter substrate-binding protein [Pelomonas sp. KK5]
MAASLFSGMASADPLKIDFVYQSPVGDVGWVAQHEAARKNLEKEFGSQIKTEVVENVKAGPDGARVIQDLIDGHARLLVLGSFGYMSDGLAAAADNPKVNFVHASGYKLAPNFGTYNARWYEGAYVAGVVAGKMTRSNTLGFVGAMPIPDVVSTINAFARGARSVNPSAVVKVVWVNDWYNPGREREVAQSLIANGADVIGSAFQDAPAVVQYADSKGVWSIGMFSDVSRYAPKGLLTSIMHDWTPYLRQVVKDSLAGSFKGAPYLASLKNKGVNLAPWNKAVPATVVAMAQQAQADIESGRLLPFAGPLKDSAGKERVAAGKALSDQDIAGMNWFIEGIQGTVPH